MATEGRVLSNRSPIQVIRANSRGHFNHGWLNTYHSFSFGDYYDPSRMGYRSLRVMNEDWIDPGMGFGSHPHRDMEILTYVLEGTVYHEDSLGHGGPIRAGELQRISAGTGIFHSERNASESEPVHLYQIWLFPDRKNHAPGYEQRSFDEAGRQGRWQLVASTDGREGSLTIHQDASIYLAKLGEGETIEHQFEEDRRGWLQVVRGQVRLEGSTLEAGDGVTIEGVKVVSLEGESEAEVLLFDLN